MRGLEEQGDQPVDVDIMKELFEDITSSVDRLSGRISKLENSLVTQAEEDQIDIQVDKYFGKFV